MLKIVVPHSVITTSIGNSAAWSIG